MFTNGARRIPCNLLLICVALASAATARGQERPGFLPAVEPHLEEALSKTCTVDFDGRPLSEVIATLEHMLGLPIELDRAELAKYVPLDGPVTVYARDVRLASLLDLVLEGVGADWIERHDGLTVTSQEWASEHTEMKFYPVGHLVYALGGGDEEGFGTLIELITSRVRPDAWDDTGGPGTVRQFPPSLMLVSQSRKLHAELLDYLAVLEKVYGLPVRRPKPSPSLEAVHRVLDAEFEFEFLNANLGDAIAQIAKSTEISLAVDAKALDDGGVSLENPVTAVVAKQKFRHGLRALLAPFGLAWVVRHGAVVITTQVEDENNLAQEFYHVADLIDPKRAGAMTIESVVEYVTSTIAPDSWDDTGGPGRVYVAPQGILVVDQTAQWHEEVAATLALLREAVKAEEDEVAELPDAGRPNQAQRQPLQRAIYHVGHFAAKDVVQAIRGTVAPETWKGAGGEGAIHIVRP
ncbi:MAG TPA: hypothetical protein VGX76_06270, partial [Pirellulales bacterium]|nr:hypothetical protein [Pirellulales bacterium]